MSQTPVTVTYSLESVLARIEGKIDDFKKDVDGKIDSLSGKIDNLSNDVNDLKVGQAKLEAELKGEIKALSAEVKGIGKRLDTQEFINRSVVVGFVLAISAGAVKLFFPNFPN